MDNSAERSPFCEQPCDTCPVAGIVPEFREAISGLVLVAMKRSVDVDFNDIKNAAAFRLLETGRTALYDTDLALSANLAQAAINIAEGRCASHPQL